MQPHPSPSPIRRTPRVVVVGAGVGGLVSAALLARQGLDVRVLEQADAPGGKLGTVSSEGRVWDAGPTVLTMRWVFDAIFDALGLVFEARVGLRPCEVLARHAWGADRFDLLAEPRDAAEALAAFAGPAEARRYGRFCERAAAVFHTLDRPFLQASRPNPVSLAWRVGLHRLPALWGIAPFRSLWAELGTHFHDPRLRQLFGRYATYCGSSPFDAPATLMLVAHVEREAVWQLDGGLASLGDALVAAARLQGVHIACGRGVQALQLGPRGVGGVLTHDGELIEADAVVFNGDARALHAGALGAPVAQAMGGPRPAVMARSLSALTTYWEAETEGFELSHHNVFFSPPAQDGYRREFEALAAGRLPAKPTVYVCAQDRSARLRGPARRGPERLMALVNAPAQADGRALTAQEVAACESAMWAQLAAAGLRLRPTNTPPVQCRPADWARRHPGSLGALYGAPSQGWRSAFERPTQRTPIPGLYLAGGTTHPGPGVPMAALSGQLAALQLLADRASTSPWPLAAMPGGTSMP